MGQWSETLVVSFNCIKPALALNALAWIIDEITLLYEKMK